MPPEPKVLRPEKHSYGVEFTVECTTTEDATICVLYPRVALTTEEDILDPKAQSRAEHAVDLLTFTGTAKRAPGDKPDEYVGFQLALGRALQKAGTCIIRRGNGLVKSNDDNLAHALQARSLEAQDRKAKFLAEQAAREEARQVARKLARREAKVTTTLKATPKRRARPIDARKRTAVTPEP